MEPLLTREQSRAVDEALAQAGFPTLLLMENAGRGATEHMLERYRAQHAREVRVLVGPGNNGGDGLVLARHARVHGVPVRVASLGDAALFKGDAATMRDAWRAIGGTIEAASTAFVEQSPHGVLFVDALFGTGLSRPLEGAAAAYVGQLNRLRDFCVIHALDLPSGLDADRGSRLGGEGAACVHAHATSTFGTSKPGLHTGEGRELGGDVREISLGAPLPTSVLGLATIARVAQRSHTIAPRVGATHKGDHGRVLVVGGSTGTTGAALLSARGALRAGAGLVTIATRAPEAIGPQVLEAMVHSLEADHTKAQAKIEALAQTSVLAVGPGLGRDAWARACVEASLRSAPTLVLDADALFALATINRAGLAERAAAGHATMLTPHPLELARLLGDEDARGVERDRVAAAREAAQRYSSIVLLKGAGSVVARPDGRAYIVDAAEPTLGVAGSGDVLTGAIAARLAERDEGATRAVDADRVVRSTLEAVTAHLRAGASLRARHASSRGALAHEIADRLAAELEAR